jgi:non-canonical purine NTP pyrophosphatase (RdgB/HAM1 family)
MKILFLTGNKGKLDEAKAIIPEIEGMEVELVEIQEIDSRKIIEHKLAEAARQTTENLMVDDVSVSLECLKGMPGPLIKWFLKTLGNEGIVEITKKMGNNRAEVCAQIGFRNNDGTVEFFEGLVKGIIVEPRGENGFGWDAIFQPDGSDKTYAEMSMEEKNGVSHRRLALEKLKQHLGRI